MTKIKKIGIDARLYFQTGVGVYLRNLIHYLPKFSDPSSRYYIYVLKKDSSKIILPKGNFILREVDSNWHSITEQIKFYGTLMKDDLNLMHFTYFSYPVLYRRPFIATIHDITPITFKTGRASTLPKWAYSLKHNIYKFILFQQIKNSMTIVVPTNAVKKNIIELYGANYSEKIKVIYEGVNHEFFEAKENISLKNKFPVPFFLYVGNFYPHKNVEKLIEAFKIANVQTPLVLAGPESYFSAKLKTLIDDKGIKNIYFFHPSKIEDMKFLYKNARALINPSLSEGFGLPLLEATYFGCPVIASDLPVFHETLGDDFVSFDPNDVSDIAKKLQTNKLKSATNLSQFSFEKMTKEIVDIYNDHTRHL